MGGEVVLKLPFILGHVDAATAATAASTAIMEDCTLAACQRIDVPDCRDRWATTRTDEQDDTTNNTSAAKKEPEDASCRDNDEDDEQAKQQSQSTDDSHRTTSVEDFIVQQENTAAANWKLTTMDECGGIKDTSDKIIRKDTVRQSTITTTLARANCTDMTVDMIVDEEEHLRQTAHEIQMVKVTSSGRKSSIGKCEGRPSGVSNNRNNSNNNANVITAQIHI